MEPSVFGVIATLVAIVAKVIEVSVKPLFEKFLWDKFWIPYVTAPLSGVLVWFTGLNAFPIFPNAILGRVVTTVIGALGPSVVYDIVDLIVGTVKGKASQ